MAGKLRACHARAIWLELDRNGPMFERILIVYDGSGPARHAFGVAADLGKKHGSEIHVVAVARPTEFAEDVEAGARNDVKGPRRRVAKRRASRYRAQRGRYRRVSQCRHRLSVAVVKTDRVPMTARYHRAMPERVPR